MSWKQVRIFLDNIEDYVMIDQNPEGDGVVMRYIEEYDKERSVLNLTFEEAETIGKELIKYVEDLKAKRVLHLAKYNKQKQ